MPVVCPLGLLSIHPRRDPARTAVDSRTGRQESVSARGEDRGMALTNIQREVCRLIARQRIASGESYIAGGAALNTVLHAPRISQDLDLFHDTAAALAATWNVDRTALLMLVTRSRSFAKGRRSSKRSCGARGSPSSYSGHMTARSASFRSSHIRSLVSRCTPLTLQRTRCSRS